MNPQLLTLAFPTMAAADAAFLEDVRRRHGEPALPAHVTMVFGSSVLSEAEYTAHVRKVAAAQPPIPFRCRWAMLWVDDEQPLAYVFLVPDEGFAAVSRLHDELYRGPLAEALRLDLPYTPHITLARSASRAQAKAWCDELNAQRLDIAGSLHTLTVASSHHGRLVRHAEWALCGAAEAG